MAELPLIASNSSLYAFSSCFRISLVIGSLEAPSDRGAALPIGGHAGPRAACRRGPHSTARLGWAPAVLSVVYPREQARSRGQAMDCKPVENDCAPSIASDPSL